MRSSRITIGLWLCARAAIAQDAKPFGVERFYPSPAGAGWFVMDDLDLHGKVGGAMDLTVGYDHDPLVVGGLPVVSDRLFANFGGALTYDRFRFSLNFDLPFLVEGESGVVGGYTYTAPNVDPSTVPDPIGDVRVGADVRLLGDAHGPFRLGLGAQFFYPSARAEDYDTDGTFHAMLRVLFAGNVGRVRYAGQIGAHFRWLDDPAPGGPKGSEALFGVAVGPGFDIGTARQWQLVVGPEVFGATALRSMFGGSATALEGLLSARLEGTRADVVQVRIKLGAGVGNAQFGAPDWRVLAGIEIFNHNHVDR